LARVPDHRRAVSGTTGRFSLAALRIAAVETGVAALLAHQAGRAAARAAGPGAGRRRGSGGGGRFDGVMDMLGAGLRVAGEVALDYAADGRQQRGDVAAVHPAATARIEHRLELFGDEADVAAAPKHRRDHP